MALPFKYYILNEQEIESGALDLRYYTKTQADGKYVLKETGKQLIESTILSDLTDGGNTTLHKHDDKADKMYATNIVTNGDFSNGTTGWSASASSLSSSSNTLIVTARGTSAYGMAYQDTSIASLVGKKIYFRSKVRVTNTLCSAIDLNVDGISGGTDQTSYLNAPIQNTWYVHSFIATQPSGVSGNIRLKITHSYVDAATANGKVMEVQYVQALDLTSTFGAGNEPTKEQVDRLLSTYPNSWFNGTVEITNIKQVFNEKADRVFATNLVTNGDFSNGTTGWTNTSPDAIISVSNNKLLAGNKTTETSAQVSANISKVANHKYYVRAMFERVSGTINTFDIYSANSNPLYIVQGIFPDGIISGLFVADTTEVSRITFIARCPAGTLNTFNLSKAVSINLTALFGVGNETTKEQMDWIFTERDRLGLGHLNGTAELLPMVSLLNLINNKVDKVSGKSLVSDADITDLTDGNETTLHKHSASNITNTPSGGISSNTVQGAINELDSEKADKLFATNLVTNGDFSNGTTGWLVDGALVSVMNKILSITGTGLSSSVGIRQLSSVSYVPGKKIYSRMRARVTNPDCNRISIVLFDGANYYVAAQQLTISNYEWYEISNVTTLLAGGNKLDIMPQHRYVDAATSNGKVMEVQYVLAIDLTAIFGAGKEPTKEQMDWLLAQKFTNSWFNGTAELTSITDLLTLVNTKADKTQEAWITPTLLNGWVAWSGFGGGQLVRYRKNQFGQLELRGFISGVSTRPSTVFNLPVGYRPTNANNQSYVITIGADVLTQIRIMSNGDVIVQNGGSGTNWVSLNGIIVSLD